MRARAAAGLALGAALAAGCGPRVETVAVTPGAATAASTARAPRPVPPPRGDSARPRPAAGPLTRAERSDYAATSSHADVLAFLDSLALAVRARGGTLARGVLGRTGEGREIPYVIASRPAVASLADARATRRPVVYVQGNIHGGEVEGKEALQMLLRDLLLDPAPNVLDSIVLVAVPIYNADGNEAWGPQERQRGAQHGPPQIGQRPNAAGLDLNRDYVRAEAPETRASLAMLDTLDPHVFVDLHTTNGSYHGYALTYAPSLHPAAPLGGYTRALLAEVRRRVAARHGYATYDYGNFGSDGPGGGLGTPRKDGWYTYDHRPRFGTNYVGLRGRIAVLSEAYSHDPFGRRVAATYAFVRELLGAVGDDATAVLATVNAPPPGSPEVALRSALPDAPPHDWIVVERLEATGDTLRTEPGGPRGFRRTGRYEEQWMPSATAFEATLSRPMPAAFVVPAGDTATVRRLRHHGVAVETLAQPWTGTVHALVVDSVVLAARPFQGHREARVEGTRFASERRTLPAGTHLVRTAQRLGRLATVLLDPRSDDGLATWNHFDDRLRPGAEFPVWELRDEVP